MTSEFSGGEEMGKVGRQFQVEPVWFLFAVAK